jgi:hypothetical protein
MFEHSPAWPHGEIEEVLPDIFFVTGTNRTHHAGVDLQTSRGMVAVRQPDGLALLNTVRLDDDGLRKLESVGPIAHVVRLGAFHGRDDPFYRDRYGAKLWALPGSMHADGREADHALVPHGMLPLRDAELFVFESAKYPEAALLLRRDGGVLVTCDSVQNWATIDRYFSPESGAQFMAQGLIRPANIPATWLGACEPDASDFRRLLALEFRHLISAHGEPLLHDAHSQVSMRAAEIFDELSAG